MAIVSHPEFAGGYQGKAMVLRDEGEYAAARDALLQGDKALDKSADVHYMLGEV